MKIPPYQLIILLGLALFGAYSIGRLGRDAPPSPVAAEQPAQSPPLPPSTAYVPTTPVQRAEIQSENGVVRVEATASFAPTPASD